MIVNLIASIMDGFKFVSIFLVACLIGVCESEQHVHIVPDSYESWSDHDYLDFSYIMEKSTPYMNVTQKVLKTIPDLEAHIESHVKSLKDPNHFVQTNATFSLCDVLNMKSMHPMSAFLFASMRSHGTMPEKCPIEPGTYRMTKVWPPENHIPPSFPAVEVEFNVQMFAVDNGKRHMILNNKMKGHTMVNNKGGPARSLLSSLMKG